MSLSALITKLQPTRTVEQSRNHRAVLCAVWTGNRLEGYSVVNLDGTQGRGFTGAQAWDEACEEMKSRAKSRKNTHFSSTRNRPISTTEIVPNHD